MSLIWCTLVPSCAALQHCSPLRNALTPLTSHSLAVPGGIKLRSRPVTLPDINDHETWYCLHEELSLEKDLIDKFATDVAENGKKDIDAFRLGLMLEIVIQHEPASLHRSGADREPSWRHRFFSKDDVNPPRTTGVCRLAQTSLAGGIWFWNCQLGNGQGLLRVRRNVSSEVPSLVLFRVQILRFIYRIGNDIKQHQHNRAWLLCTLPYYQPRALLRENQVWPLAAAEHHSS
ncbi:hypothetical protein CONLIGDRAFT_670161 [Coniochaeta ligniaria NRRL 30616]|uniref:Uncharacterized protein n=1 Tax=Coniochaeta ligniaria NRRL 30616 TaxID=1408157 RepID=A0A1J7JKW1_9PEZI|nr:hypothetical protein CONLIGDRAFT_670161 [Coniochaeta ligniaria NRRL 30616]